MYIHYREPRSVRVTAANRPYQFLGGGKSMLTGSLKSAGRKRIRVIGLCAAISSALLLASQVHAQSNEGAAAAAEAGTAQEKAVELDGITVSAPRLEESTPIELAKYGNRLQIIEGEDIARRGFVDVTQALQQMAPSVSIVSKTGAFDYVYVSMQGSRSSEVLWLVDGVRINNRLFATTTPLDTIPAAMIERIEVLEGGQGLFYGTQAVAGVVNVVTKATLEKGTDGQLSIGVDSHDGRHLSGNVRTAIGPHQLVAYASNDEAKGYNSFHPDDWQPSGTDRDRSYDVTTVGVKYAVESERVRVSAGYQRTNAKLDVAEPSLIRSYYNERVEDVVSLKLDWEVSDQFGFYVKSYYHNWDSGVSEIDNVVGRPGDAVVIYDKTPWYYKDYGLNAMAKYAPGNGVEYYLGYDYQNYNGGDGTMAIDAKTEKVHAAIAQVRTMDKFVDGLALSAGFRFNKPMHGDNATVWNVSGQYNISENLFLRATTGTAYRLPDADQLFTIDPCCTQGNPGLKAEQSRNLNASIGGFFDLGQRSASWELVGFTREVENLIEEVEDPVTGIYTYQNGASGAKVKGFMATTTLPLTDSLTATASYTRTDAKQDGRQIARIPDATAKLLLNLAPVGSRFGGSLITTYSGDTHRPISGVGDVPYGNFWLVDLSAYMQFGEDDRHRLSARVENVADKRYITTLLRTIPDAGGRPYAARNIGPPRTFYLTYSYAF